MTHLGPVARISSGLVLLTCSILVVLDLAGVVPKPGDQQLASRVNLSETLAAQTAAAAERNDLAAIRKTLQVSVHQNDDVLSAGLRAPDGRLIVAVGDHRALWEREAEERAPSTHVDMPLYKSGKRWGTIELRFEEMASGGLLASLWARPLLRMLVFLSVSGFLAYLLYMRRTLRHLDPSAVVPARVQAALDVMAEGVVILDEHDRIVLANAAFADWTGRERNALLGSKASKLDWEFPDSPGVGGPFPWIETVRDGKASAAARMVLSGEDREPRSLLVKAAPVLDGWGRAKGAIATFDDVTELERRTEELQRALRELEKSQDEIQLQNEELRVLARSDPLTGVANRRAFMDVFETYFVAAKREGRNAACLMVDIDHFKAVNDNHGHQMGDEVIQCVTGALAKAVRSTDAVCRYGGEEFCVVLADAGIEAGATVAERMRKTIASPGFAPVPVTASFGVSAIACGAASLPELIDQADQALYVSKQTGRNRVTRWDQRGGAGQEDPPPTPAR